MKLRVLLDMDGVIANFYKGFADYLNKNYGCTLNLNEEPKNYDFDKWGCGVDGIDFDKASKEWIEQDGFGKLPVFDGAEEFVEKLMSISTIYIVTARIGDWEQKFSEETKKRIENNTYGWLKKHNMPIDKLFFTHEKIDFCKENGISVMIEDKLSTALNAAKNGISTILMDRGYNESQIDRFKIYRVFNFNDAIEQLEKMETQ